LGDTVTIDDDGGGGGDDDSVKVIVWMSLSLSAPSDDDIPRTVRFFFFQFGMDFFVDTSSSFSFKGNWSSFYLFILYFILKRQKLEPSPRSIEFLLDLLHYIYNYYHSYTLYLLWLPCYSSTDFFVTCCDPCDMTSCDSVTVT